MKDRKCAPNTNRQATSETDTWMVSFMESLRRIEHWVLVTAADCPSAIQSARLKLRAQLKNPLGGLDFLLIHFQSWAILGGVHVET